MKTISPLNYQVNVAAPPVVPTHAVGGYADGADVIAIKRNNKSVKTRVGVDGKATALISADRSGMITLKLDQASRSNKVLAGIMALIEGGTQSFAPVFIQFLDLSRQDAAIGTFGLITGWPDLARGDEAADQEWEIFVERLDLVLGDPAFTGLAAAIAEAA